jgi:hypothetical protein
MRSLSPFFATTVAAVVLSVTLPVAAAGPSFTGTYSAKTDDGIATLTLKQEGDGSVNGSLRVGGGDLELKGRAEAEGKRASGVVRLNGMDIPMKWEVLREANALRFSMIMPDTNKPDPDTTVVFPLNGKSSAPVAEEKPASEEKTVADTPAASATPATLAGAYKGAEVTLTLKAGTGGALTGTVQQGGKTYPVTARATAEDGVEGAFKAGDDSFDFKASLGGDGKTLVFETGGTTHLLARQGGAAVGKAANPLAGSAAKPKPSNPFAETGGTPAVAESKPVGTAKASAATGDWKTYSHPAGVSFKYPGGWTMREGDGAVVLVPPGVTVVPNTLPTEVYLMRANPAPSISRVDDPAVIALYDKEMTPMAQVLQRTDGPEPLTVGAQKGMALTWVGTNPQTGKAVEARLYATLQSGIVLTLAAVGDKDKLAAREKTARAIFESLQGKEGERDPRLVGEWQGGVVDNGKLLTGVGGRTTGSTASDSSKRFRFLADGSVLEITHSRTIVIAAGASLDSGDNYETKKGRWTAGDGRLTISFEDGRAINAGYQFNGNTLVVQYPNGSKQQFARR